MRFLPAFRPSVAVGERQTAFFETTRFGRLDSFGQRHGTATLEVVGPMEQGAWKINWQHPELGISEGHVSLELKVKEDRVESGLLKHYNGQELVTTALEVTHTSPTQIIMKTSADNPYNWLQIVEDGSHWRLEWAFLQGTKRFPLVQWTASTRLEKVAQ